MTETTQDDTHIIGMTVAAFKTAQHMARIEERYAIVAWLRERDGLEDCYSELKGDWLSNRIEAGEYLK